MKINMNYIKNIVTDHFLDPIRGYTIDSLEKTLYTAREGEIIHLTPENIMTLGEVIQGTLDSIDQGRHVEFWTVRSNKSYKKIMEEGLVNSRAIELIKDNGRHDEQGFGSIYLRLRPQTAINAKNYRNWLIGHKEETDYSLLSVTLKLTGEYEKDYLIVPSVSSAVMNSLYPNSFDINFVIRSLIDCNEKRLTRKIPFEEVSINKVDEFTFYPEEVKKRFSHLPDSIKESPYGIQMSKGITT
jgi:hypothetical protein